MADAGPGGQTSSRVDLQGWSLPDIFEMVEAIGRSVAAASRGVLWDRGLVGTRTVRGPSPIEERLPVLRNRYSGTCQRSD